MSVELQQAQLSDYEMRMRNRLLLMSDQHEIDMHLLRHGGSGEPTAERFWLGQYNEVLVDSEHYRSSLPRSIAAVFYVAGGGGETCAIKAHEFLSKHYRLKDGQLLLLMHKPGDSPAFEEHGRPQGAPSRTQHQAGSNDVPLAGFPTITSSSSTQTGSASSSESRGGTATSHAAASNSTHGRTSTSTSGKSSPPQKLQRTLADGAGGSVEASAVQTADHVPSAAHRTAHGTATVGST